MLTDTDKEAKRAKPTDFRRKVTYYKWSVGPALALFISSVLFRVSSPLGQFSRNSAEVISEHLFSFSMAFLTAAIIQYLASVTLDRNTADQYAERVRKDNIFSPKKVLQYGEADPVINKVLPRVGRILFFGTSAKYFLSKRLLESSRNIKSRTEISLLLHNPQDDVNIQVRAEQMLKEHGETIDPGLLRAEVISAIIRAFYLNYVNAHMTFEVRLHSETPIFRLEFYGDDDLFMSFYDSEGKTEEGRGAGPIAHHEKRDNAYMYSVLNGIFFKFWDTYDSSSSSSITSAGSSSLLEILYEKFDEDLVSAAIEGILKCQTENGGLKEWLQNQKNQTAPKSSSVIGS